MSILKTDANPASFAAPAGTAGTVTRALQWLLVLELLAGLALGWWLVVPRLFAPTSSSLLLSLWIVLGGLLMVLLLRLLITANNFVLALYYRSPCPQSLSPLGWLRLFGAEFASTLYSSSWSMHHCAFAHRKPQQASGLPVLLIHGYVCNSGYWHRFSPLLQQAGIEHFALDLEPVFGDIDDYVPQVAQAVEAICHQSGHRQVIIVAHSMGGLVARAYLRAHGSAQVAHVITVGTPHHGTALAMRGPGRNSRQMEWHNGAKSEWLTKLEASETPALRARFTSIFSWHDNIVSPQLSSQLDGANNIGLFGIGHVELAMNRQVQQCTLEAIQRVQAAV
jgi:pimeloyl-ACP methyl ester carboxylesterase